MSESKKYTIPPPAPPSRVREPGPHYGARATTVSATDAKNKFADVLEAALRDGPVFIAKHGTPKAVLLSVEEYERLRGPREAAMEKLRRDADALFERMQTPECRAAMERAWAMTPEEMGRAAVEAAKKRE